MIVESCSKPYQASTMEHFVKRINDWKLLIIFSKPFILDV